MMDKAFKGPFLSATGTPQEEIHSRLEGVLKALRADYEAGRMQGYGESDIPAFLQIEKLLARFHQVAQQLRKRHGYRDSLRISDEYDVQDLLHALLRIEFDDIRPEPPESGLYPANAAKPCDKRGINAAFGEQSGTSQGCKPRCWVSVTENQLPEWNTNW
jgi:hypothetical protein